MAKKRMFSPDIVRSDSFLDMPASTQLLYFHLGMEADDDGFVSSANMVRRICGASEDDLKLLIAKRFLLVFDNGLLLIKHWKINNYIRSDRYTPTKYVDEFSAVTTKGNRAYTLNLEKHNKTTLLPDETGNVYQRYTTRYTQSSIDKISIDKNSSSCSSSSNNDNNNEEKFRVFVYSHFRDTYFNGDYEACKKVADRFYEWNKLKNKDFISWPPERVFAAASLWMQKE